MTTHPVAAAALDELRAHGLTLGCAESLTGGLLSAAVVAVPGASDVHRGAVVAYAAEVKAQVLGVDLSLLDAVGTVHPDVAAAMAKGAQRVLRCDVALATTGVAGPGPSEGHPAGTVHLACAWGEEVHLRRLDLPGERAEVREASVRGALDLLLAVASSHARGTVGSAPQPHVEREEGRS